MDVKQVSLQQVPKSAEFWKHEALTKNHFCWTQTIRLECGLNLRPDQTCPPSNAYNVLTSLCTGLLQMPPNMLKICVKARGPQLSDFRTCCVTLYELIDIMPRSFLRSTSWTKLATATGLSIMLSKCVLPTPTVPYLLLTVSVL